VKLCLAALAVAQVKQRGTELILVNELEG